MPQKPTQIAVIRRQPTGSRKKIAARFLEHAEDYLGQGSNAHLHPMLAQHLAMASLTKV